jgi:ribosome-associated toxin RatA of RatAB toxin-antitoxin module
LAEIISKREIPHAPAVVFAAARQVTRFPDVLSNLDSVEVLEDDGQGSTVTRWLASFSVGPLTKQVAWTERDHWDENALTCRFDLVEGDMKTYNGVWTFSANSTGCLVDLRVDFELGIAMLGPMIDKIVNQLMQKNCDDLLEALEELAGQ